MTEKPVIVETSDVLVVELNEALPIDIQVVENTLKKEDKQEIQGA